MDWKKSGMTLRELVGVALLVGLLLLGLFSSWQLNRQHRELVDTLSDSSWMALSGQLENARKGAQQVQQRWEKRRSLWAAASDHGPLEEIDTLLEELRLYGLTGQKEEFARVCALAAQKLESLGQDQRLYWWNIL